MTSPLPALRVGPYRLAYQPITAHEECPCGGTLTHHYAWFAGGRDEPPSEEHLSSEPCDQCGCHSADECHHQPTGED